MEKQQLGRCCFRLCCLKNEREGEENPLSPEASALERETAVMWFRPPYLYSADESFLLLSNCLNAACHGYFCYLLPLVRSASQASRWNAFSLEFVSLGFDLLAAPGLLLLLAPSPSWPSGTMAIGFGFILGPAAATQPLSRRSQTRREKTTFSWHSHAPRRGGAVTLAPSGGCRRTRAWERGALKRSTSMFIPQLLGPVDARPTRSSGLQRISAALRRGWTAPDDGDAGTEPLGSPRGQEP